MATKEQIEMIIKKAENVIPIDFLNYLNDTQSGMMAVLKVLDDCSGTVTAGTISQVLNISTARVAVLLKKMAAKKLITKEKDVMDGRITIVKLTELGEDTIAKLRTELYRQIEIIVDNLGEEKILEFIKISLEIKSILEPMTPPGL